MAYATVEDVQARMTRTLSEGEISVCSRLLGDAAVQIDSYNQDADESVKELVSCRMVIRAIGDGQSDGVPIGATQGSQSALGYSQSWTIGGGGGTGELYVSKEERRMLGVANSIGSYSPVQEFARGDK